MRKAVTAKRKAKVEAEVGDQPEVPEDVGPDDKAGSISSLTKMLGILDIFTPTTPIWSANDIIEALGTSRSTGYRYIRGLHAVGLIGAVGNGFYVLGPRIVELDLQIRECDPLHRASEGILEDLAGKTGHSALLCMLFSSSVLCIREHIVPSAPKNLFSRGQRRPLFRGAVSKVILPHLPSHRLRNIFLRNRETIAEAGLGADWESFKRALGRIRSDGYAMTYAEFNPGVYGIAAPVFNRERLILGSVGVAWRREGAEEADAASIAGIVAAVKRAADAVSQRIAQATGDIAMPPRAVG